MNSNFEKIPPDTKYKFLCFKKTLSAVAYVSLLVRVVQVDDSVLSDFCLILY